MDTRIGFGYDSHEFKPGVPLRIGGMTLDHPEGLAGHSDGDVLLHAITDALLGAVAAGDIGSFFPPGDPRWKDADSAIFLNLALEELQHAGYRIVNIDTTLVLAAPKISPIAGEMRARVADLLGVEIDQVSIKAKTPEGLNLDHVAQCHAVALVERVQEPEELKSMSEVIESQRQLEDVVEDLLSSVHGVPKKRVIDAGLRHRRHHVSATVGHSADGLLRKEHPRRCANRTVDDFHCGFRRLALPWLQVIDSTPWSVSYERIGHSPAKSARSRNDPATCS